MEGEWGLMTAEDAGMLLSDRAETRVKVITLFPSFCSAVLRVWLLFFSVAHGHKVAAAAPGLSSVTEDNHQQRGGVT